MNKTENDNHQEILTNRRQVREIIHDAWKVIHAHNIPIPKIFRRHDNLVQLGKENGAAVLKTLRIEDIFGILLRIADWVRMDQNGNILPSRPPKDVARDLLTFADFEMPSLEGVITTPIFAEDGTLLNKEGYHQAFSLYLDLDNALEIAPIPSIPTKNDLEAAKSLIVSQLLGDFPFTNEADLAHAVAGIIQPFIRRLYKGCSPMFLIEAPCPGSGKGLLANVISTILIGLPAESRTLPGSDDEVRKMLTSELSRGRPLILLDNADSEGRSSKIHSSSLASALTAQIWTDRILGESRMISMPNQALWIMTANNPQLTSELARRCVRIRLDPKVESPWRKNANEFRHPDLLAWVRKNRAELIHSVFILIQTWLAHGRHQFEAKRLGSFESWSATTGAILEIAGIKGFLENLDELYQASDIEGREWLNLIEVWQDRFGLLPVRVLNINELCNETDLLDDIRGSGNEKSQQTRLGAALQKVSGRVFGEWKVHLAADRKKHGKYYCLEKIIKESRPHSNSCETSITYSENDNPDNLFPSFQSTDCGALAQSPEAEKVIQGPHANLTAEVL
jgi:putative DNA primase/helicase